MAFKFRISKVQRLPSAGVEVIDGTVLTGEVTTGQRVTLVHGNTRVPLKVHGVVLDSGRKSRLEPTLSLSFRRQPGLEKAEVGDELVAA